jgi:hypothetical protein
MAVMFYSQHFIRPYKAQPVDPQGTKIQKKNISRVSAQVSETFRIQNVSKCRILLGSVAAEDSQNHAALVILELSQWREIVSLTADLD